MKKIYRYLVFIGLINILLSASAFIIDYSFPSEIQVKDVFTLSFLFSLIAVVSLIIFLRGNSREPDSRTMHTLVSVSLKFLLDMILALAWFFITKKNSLPYVFLFFVIYLTFTLFTTFVILKILKIRSL
jgi:hypothetical protein